MPDFFTPDPSDGRIESFPGTHSNYHGSGSPEGKVAAPVQHTYVNNDNGNLWIKNTGDWTKTGWALWAPS